MIINQKTGNNWTALHGDCIQAIKELPDQSIGYSVFSPPFASLYTYSDSEFDMGNCKTHSEFYEHFRFLVKELFRVLKNGRLVSFHCMNLPTSKERDGFIGITDFRGELIRIFQEAGFIYHSEVTIWKDPVTAMQRTKALGLLHKQLIKDSAMSRQGIADYLVTMRKPGENLEPITGALDSYVGTNPPVAPFTRTDDTRNPYSIQVWQQYASPVWMDVNPSRTLQYTTARDEQDERHICPLQLDVIERALQLWSRPDDVVLSPFMGIGSEVHSSLLMGRKFIGMELKESYFDYAVKNLEIAADSFTQKLF
jgi:DNA modification methylase